MSTVLLRVSQLNAIYLDKEIFNALKQILNMSITYLPPGVIDSYEPELNLLLRLAMLNYSVLKNGSTFGQQLLAIQYEEISTFRRVVYVALHCLGYIKDRFEYWQPSHRINNTFHNIYLALNFLDLVNFTTFLCRGTKPLLIERILGLNQVYADGNTARTFNSNYLARELLWNSFIEIMVHLVPLINFHRLIRFLKNINPFLKKRSVSSLSKASMTIHSKCIYCQKTPILPHHMGCPHVFCYFCLRANLEADSKFTCPMCNHWNENILCERVTAL